MTSSGPTAAADRRRQRDDRGLAPAGAAGVDRLPRAPRQRRPLLALLAVLLIVGGAAVAGLVVLRLDARTPVLALAQDVTAGHRITADDLRSVEVSADGTLLVPAAQADQVVGRYARVALASGQLLDSTMLTGSGYLTDGSIAVGASLAVGRFPASGLQPGDVVQLVRVADGRGTVLVDEATVSAVRTGSDDSATVSAITVTLIVSESAGPEVAATAADGALSVLLRERGTPIGEG